MNKQDLKTELMALCDYGMISQDGKISAIGIFDHLLNVKDPIILTKGFLVATVSGAPETNYKIVVKAEHGNKKENLLRNLEVSVKTSSAGTANLVIELQGVTFPQPGNYSFRLYSDDIEIGSKQLVVKRVKQKEATN